MMSRTPNDGLDSGNLDTILTLPERTASTTIADDCRAAALEFLNESRHWGKAELAMWLMGSYSALTQYASPYGTRNGGTVAPAPMLREIDVRMVERVIRSAHEEVIATLINSYESDQENHFAYTMLNAGFVARCEDKGRTPAWVPTTAARRLADRVLSLLAADYLTRPAHYEFDVSVCMQCKSVQFDATVRTRGICQRHATSVCVGRAQQSSFPYLPEGA